MANEIRKNHVGLRLGFFGVMSWVAIYSTILACLYRFSDTEAAGPVEHWNKGEAQHTCLPMGSGLVMVVLKNPSHSSRP